MDNKSLFDTLGGEASISKVVDNFYIKVLSDSLVKNFFKGIDMDRQKKHMRSFMKLALGGPDSYTGRSMRDAHKRLDLEDKHFNQIAKLLAETLRDLSVSETLIKKVIDIVETTRSDVLNLDATADPKVDTNSELCKCTDGGLGICTIF